MDGGGGGCAVAGISGGNGDIDADDDDDQNYFVRLCLALGLSYLCLLYAFVSSLQFVTGPAFVSSHVSQRLWFLIG